jgi:hypothetical protein
MEMSEGASGTPTLSAAVIADDKVADYLAQEYLFLQKTVEEFDGRALTIKAWSVTFSAAGLGFAYQQHNKILLLVAAGSALAFWIVEATWKYHQRAFYPRIVDIEQWFAEQSRAGAEPFQIITRWKSEFAAGKADWIYARHAGSSWKAYAVPFFLGVMMPHVVIGAAGLLLYVFAAPTERAAGVQTERSSGSQNPPNLRSMNQISTFGRNTH